MCPPVRVVRPYGARTVIPSRARSAGGVSGRIRPSAHRPRRRTEGAPTARWDTELVAAYGFPFPPSANVPASVPASESPSPPQRFVHVLPAAQSTVFPPLHFTVHAAALP